MFNRIIRIMASAAGCALLLAGCSLRLDGPARTKEISFSAGASLLCDDASRTKFGVPINGTSFANGSSFLVYGRRNTDPLIFSPTEVSLSSSLWSYATPEYWEWTSNQDYYDFLGLYLGDMYDIDRTSIPMPSCDTGSPLSASVAYDPSVDQFDLMLAGTRRTYDEPGGRTSAVNMNFHHMLSAVRVSISNGSTSRSFTLNEFYFENLVSRGTAKVEASYDAQGNATYSWTGTTRLAAPIGGTANLSLDELAVITTTSFIQDTFNPGVTRSHDYWDLMIPQNHEGKIGSTGWPALVLVFTPYGGSQTTVRILLKDIYTDPEQGTPTLISDWEMGVKYVYLVRLNLDGGIQVHVTTTDWEDVTAETPGLLLPEFG